MRIIVSLYWVFLIAIVILAQSCETVEQKKEKCKNLVNELVHGISLSDWETIRKVYPKAPGHVFVFEKIKLESYDFGSDTSVVFGTGIINEGQKNEFSRKVKLLIITGSKPKIVESNGLSFYYESAHHKILQLEGCFSGHANDYILDSIVKRTKYFFENKVRMFAESRAEYFVTKDHYNNNYGIVDGHVYVNNNTMYSFGFGELNCKTVFYNAKKEIVGAKQHMIMNALRAGGSDDFMVFTVPSNATFSKTYVTISDEAVERLIKDNLADFNTFFSSICDN